MNFVQYSSIKYKFVHIYTYILLLIPTCSILFISQDGIDSYRNETKWSMFRGTKTACAIFTILFRIDLLFRQ